MVASPNILLAKLLVDLLVAHKYGRKRKLEAQEWLKISLFLAWLEIDLKRNELSMSVFI
jgi:hypothetical protein